MDFQRMLDYCAALEKHNERAWFHEHHRQYEEARADWYTLLNRLRFVIAGAAPALSQDILYMQPRDWTYRIARDMRYYKDRPPYNPSFRAYLSADRKSWLPIGYFLRISAGDSCFGTGIWFEDTASVNIVRDYLMEHYDRWEELVAESGLPISGSTLKKMPRGYPEEHPAAPWLKYKDWSVIQDIPREELTTFDDFEETIRRLTEKMEPLRLFWLEAAQSGRTQKQALGDFYRY